MSQPGYLDTLLDVIGRKKDVVVDEKAWNTMQYLLPLWIIISTAYINLEGIVLSYKWEFIVTLLSGFLVFSFWFYRSAKAVVEVDKYFPSMSLHWKLTAPILIGNFF